MNLVYLGSGQFGIPSLEAIERSSHRIQLMVSQPASPAGRGRRPHPTPVAEWAARRNMPLIETPCCNAPPVIEHVAAAGGDLIVVIAFGQRIGRTLIDLPPKGIINVHASLLPKYRGAAPINWAIINGETRTGVSIITVCDHIDAGDVLAERATDIAPRETAGELHDRLAELAAPLLVETLDRIADGTATYTEQDHSRATAAPSSTSPPGCSISVFPPRPSSGGSAACGTGRVRAAPSTRSRPAAPFRWPLPPPRSSSRSTPRRGRPARSTATCASCAARARSR